MYQGVQLTWHSNGQLARRMTYTEGREAELQQGWKPDGALLFSYVYRSGRRYGVLGSVPCFTVRNS